MLASMAFYREQVLPRVRNRLLDLGGTREIRARVCAGLRGEVIEIGFGSGLNLPFLPDDVATLWAVEPSRVARALSTRRRADAPVPVVFAADDAGALPFPDQRFDAALSTWTMCTLPDPVAALREVRRVLKPGRTLHFVEHGASPDEPVARWQDRATPLWHQLAGGCNLNRDVPGLLARAGFTVTTLETYYERRAPKVLGHMYEGRAVA